MKKLLYLLIFGFVSLALIGCNENKQPTPEQPTPETPVPTPTPQPQTWTVAELIEIATAAGDAGTAEAYRVQGKITNIAQTYYGNMTIEDSTGSLFIYGTLDANGNKYGDMAEKPHVGDIVVLEGRLKTYNGSVEMENATIISFETPTPEINENEYTESTIAAAREAESGAKLKVSGVVARITYAFGLNPNGFYLIDSTGSIYIHGQVAQQVSIGDTVTIAAEKTYYILEDEKGFAAKYGYEGACQLQYPILLEQEKGNAALNLSWVEEKTVKEIMDTPVTEENITSNVFKVTTLINKVAGTGFTNYYFNDLDGETGSYAYSACGGDDFTWLDEFDGKFCTVYLSPINCKSTAGGCFYRFVPIQVSYEGYTFDLNDAAEYAVVYHALDQFKETYLTETTFDLINTVSSELLGFENVTLSYSSSNEDVLSFTSEEGKVVMNNKTEGKVTVTITATYNSVTFSKEVEVSVKEPVEYDSITIAEAIATPDETMVIVEGVIVSSLVNKTGFYISDATGIIAVTCAGEDLAGLSVGNYIVIEGKRIHNRKYETVAGQSVILDAKILENRLGSHEYDDSKFDATKTLADLSALPVTEDYSTNVYVVTATVVVVETPYYTSIKIQDGNTSMNLYSSSAGQYNWLKKYNGQEITMELALCNWNDKNYYAGCVISVLLADGTKEINTLNFN